MPSNQRRFDETPEFDSDFYDRSDIWFGAFCELRGLLGAERADRILAQVWRSARRPARREGSSARFVAALLEEVRAVAPGREASVEAMFRRRGFPVPG
jgi:hypothetical protein